MHFSSSMPVVRLTWSIVEMDDDLLLLLLLEDEEEEEIELLQALVKERAEKDPLYKTRGEEGCYSVLVNGHLKDNEEKWRQFFRLNQPQFQFVLDLVRDDMKKYGTNAVKRPISPEEKLAVTLRYLATGETFRSLSFAFRISHCYISVIIKETLKALCNRLVPLLLPSPNHKTLKKNALYFWDKWNFPNCVCAIDGKHVRIFCPKASGSLFFNYKEYFSIVLLAMVDANCKFVAIDVGSYGKEGDSGIFNKSEMGKQVLSGNFFPPDERLPVCHKLLPYVVIGDEAFRLHRHIMKPYNKVTSRADRAKTIFNYRLTRARRVTENAFGLLSQVFRVFYTPISVTPETCETLIITACCLHNLLRDGYLEKHHRPQYEYDSNVDPPANIVSLGRTGGFAGAEGFEVRDILMKFFNEEGALNWQEERVFRLRSID